MSYLEDSAFPGRPTGLPPSPTIENPGRVFPKTDPAKGSFQSFLAPGSVTPSQYVGNPFLMNSALDKLDHALGQVILILEQEGKAERREGSENEFLEKFRNWKSELEVMRAGEAELNLPTDVHSGIDQEGGMFAD